MFFANRPLPDFASLADPCLPAGRLSIASDREGKGKKCNKSVQNLFFVFAVTGLLPTKKYKKVYGFKIHFFRLIPALHMCGLIPTA